MLRLPVISLMLSQLCQKMIFKAKVESIKNKYHNFIGKGGGQILPCTMISNNVIIKKISLFISDAKYPELKQPFETWLKVPPPPVQLWSILPPKMIRINHRYWRLGLTLIFQRDYEILSLFSGFCLTVLLWNHPCAFKFPLSLFSFSR